VSLFYLTFRFHLSGHASLPNAQFITCWLLLLQFTFFFTLLSFKTLFITLLWHMPCKFLEVLRTDVLWDVVCVTSGSFAVS